MPAVNFLLCLEGTKYKILHGAHFGHAITGRTRAPRRCPGDAECRPANQRRYNQDLVRTSARFPSWHRPFPLNVIRRQVHWKDSWEKTRAERKVLEKKNLKDDCAVTKRFSRQKREGKERAIIA